MKNENYFNLIERILILGPAELDLEKLLNKSNSTPNDLSNVPSKILEEYKSINLIDENDMYTENINMFCFPENVKILQSNGNIEPSYFSFTIISKYSKRKFCSCLVFYENLPFNKQIYLISKVICIISPIEIFNTAKEILKNIHSIILNFKNTKESKTNQSQLAYVYIKDEKNKTSYKNVIKEYKLLEFYFGFLLNSLKLKKEERSYFVQHIGNNLGKKAFLDFHVNSKSFLKLKDFDISVLMDLINVENLIKLYIGMLMEYKIILVFENYEAINKIIFALLSLLFPMKWKLPIISYALEALIDSLEAPFGMICGLHCKFLPLLKQKIEQKLIGEETLVFNLCANSFVFFPEDFPELPRKITNELKSNFYLILSEKLSINNGIKFASAEYSAIFPDGIKAKVNVLDFLNLKFSLVFVNCFLEIIRNLEEFIDQVKLSKLKQQVNTRIIVSDLLDLNKLYAKEGEKENNPKFIGFLDQLTKTIMFTHFFEKYLTRSDKSYKYKTIKSYLKLMKSQQDNYKTILNDYNKEKIRNKMINYYDYKYISLEAALKKYLEKAETSSFTSLNSHKSNAFAPKLLWNKLDIKKMNIFNFNYDLFLIQEQDEFVSKIAYRTIFSELLKKRDSKAYELEDEENVDRPMINNNETKLKSHLEIIQANKRKKKDFPSLSLDDKTLYDIYESGLSGINNTFSSKNKINFQRNFENIRNSDLSDYSKSKETGLFSKQAKFEEFLKSENKKINFQQNIYVNNFNITNNFNNLTLNSANGNSSAVNAVDLSNAKENAFFTAAQRNFDFEGFGNLNSSSFNDISNFTYSEKPSNKSCKKVFENIESKSNNNFFNQSNFMKSEILNVNLNSNDKNNFKNENINYNNNNINFSNFSNFNNFNFETKKNFVINSDVRNSLNLSSFDKKSFSPRRNADTVIQNKLVSRNQVFFESGNLEEINRNINYKFYGIKEHEKNNNDNVNNNSKNSENSNAVNLEYSNKNVKNFGNILESNNKKNNNISNNHNLTNSDNTDNNRNNNYRKIDINNLNNKNNNNIRNNNSNSKSNYNNYEINNTNKTSTINLTKDAINIESNQNSRKTISAMISGSEKTSSASGFSNGGSDNNNNKINLKLIPIARKCNYPNIPSNNNIHNFINNNYYRDVGNSPNKNSIFLDFLDKSKNIQTHHNHSNISKNNHFILNSSNRNNNNVENNSNAYNNIINNNNNNLENESFRNSKNSLSNKINKNNNNNENSINKTTRNLNDSGFLKQNTNTKLINNNNNKTSNLHNTSLSEARNFQLKLNQQQQQQQLNTSNIRINNNFSENFGLEAISPSKRNSQPICFASIAQGKRPAVAQVPVFIKMQMNAKINGNPKLNDFDGDNINNNNNNNKKIEATNTNLEIIKRLSGDDDKDVFGD